MLAGLLLGRRARTSPVALRGEVVLKVTFGPSRSPLMCRAISYATEHAQEMTELEPGVWRASFRLGAEERPYGEAAQFVAMVGRWHGTVLEVDGSPELRSATQYMLVCAREWLRREGRCAERFRVAQGWPKCRLCPLYDAEWAAESGAGPGIMLSRFDPDAQRLQFEIPDHVPKDWEAG